MPSNVRRIAISQLKANPDNPRVIHDDKLQKLVTSVRTFPQMLDLRPLVVTANYVVLGGNQRLKACELAGLTEVPVVIADELTPEQQREFIIKDNVGYGEWDWNVLANEWADEPLQDWAVDIPLVGNFDKVSVVNKGDENSEWVGMPEFESVDKPYKIIISFDTVETRTEFAQTTGLVLQNTERLTWAQSWPFVPRDDTKNVRYE